MPATLLSAASVPLAYLPVRVSCQPSAISAGLITVNGAVCSEATVLHNGDVICHTLHRHEPPVADTEPRVLHCDDTLLVVDKPASLAVHSCGRYWHNTLMGVLQHNGYGQLYRQDRAQHMPPPRSIESSRYVTDKWTSACVRPHNSHTPTGSLDEWAGAAGA